MNFRRAQSGRRIGGKVRIAGAAAENDNSALFQMSQRLAGEYKAPPRA